MSPEPDSAAVPERVGPYRLVGRLGEGGMGVVYRAVHVETGEVAALKTVRVPNAAHLRAIRREIHALRRVRHPGVVRIVDEGVERGLPWYAMELLTGSTVRRWLHEIWSRHLPDGGGPARTSTVPHADPRARRLDAARSPSPSLPPPPPSSDPSPSPHSRSRPSPPSASLASPPPLVVATGASTARALDAARAPAASSPPRADAPRPLAAAGALDEVLILVRRLCDPLAFLHGEGIVHRDLNPENVFLRPDGTPVLMDFGIVSRFGGAAGREALEYGTAEGTLGYVAPEQLRGDLVDARADLYSLGALLYEALTGRVPPAMGAPPPSALVDGVPPALDALVLRLLARHARERVGYAADVAAALDAIRAAPAGERAPPPGAPSSATSAPSPSASVEQAPSRPAPVELTPALAPLPAPRPYLYRPGFAGRDDLVRRVQPLLDGLADGRGGRVLVAGPSGAGKTRLAMEIATLATARGYRVVTGECQPLQLAASSAVGAAPPRAVAAAPLHPFRPLLQAIADECRTWGPAETARLLGRRASVLALYEPALARLPGEEARAEPARLPGPAARLRVLSDFAETIAAYAEADPLLLVLDDLQWADELTHALLARLQPSWLDGVRLLVVGTYRSEEVSEPLRELASAPGVVHLRLGRLDEATVGSMVSDMLALPAPPEAFVQHLARQSEGNPFFVAEYLRAAVGERLLRRDDAGQWQVTERGRAVGSLEAALPLPGSLRELVLRRLDALPPETRRLVEVAAVLGREIDAEWLRPLSQLGELVELEGVRQLLSRQIVEDAGPGRLRFVHDKLREIAYEQIPAERRRSLHAAAARALEAQGAQPLLYALLAHHFTAAGDDDKSLEYLEKAGEHALRTGAHAAAADYFRRALALDDRRRAEPGGRAASRLRRAGWERSVGVALYGLGDLVGSSERMAVALDRLGHPLPASRAGWARRLVAQLARQAAHVALPSRAVEHASRRPRLGDAASAAARMAENYYFGGDILAMVASTLLAVNLSERAAADAAAPRPYAQLGYTAGFFRLHRLARRYFARADAASRAADDPSGRVYALYVEAAYHLGFAEWAVGEDCCRRAKELLERIGDRQETEILDTLVGSAEYFRGDFAASYRRFAAIRDSARSRANIQHEAWGAYAMARALQPPGRHDEAVALLEEALPPLVGQSDRASEVICRGLLATSYLAVGRDADARRMADLAVARAAGSLPTAFPMLHGYSGPAEVYLALWERSRARSSGAAPSHVTADEAALATAAARAVAALGRYALLFPLGVPAWLRCRGRLRRLRGQRRRARADLLRSARRARHRDMPLDEALAHLELARAAHDDAERRAHDSEARALLTRLGLVPVPRAR